MGIDRQKVQAGSLTFVQRFGGSLNVNLHYHFIFLEGIYLDRSTQSLQPRFVKIAAPTDAEITAVVTKISHRVIRKLQKLGYLEAGIDAAVATGYDPLVDEEPELAHTLAGSVQQRIAFGARAGQQVRRIGSGFGYAGERPTLTGPRCASVHGFSLHANTHIPAHRRDQFERLIRYTARGSVSLERLEEDANGDLFYTFPKPWSDGTTGIHLAPLELLEKLAALVPPPRVHQVVSRIDLALWGVLSAIQPPAQRHDPNSTPAGQRAGSQLGLGALGMGQTAPPRVCHRPGAVSTVPARHPAAHRGSHRPAGHPSSPASS